MPRRIDLTQDRTHIRAQHVGTPEVAFTGRSGQKTIPTTFSAIPGADCRYQKPLVRVGPWAVGVAVRLGTFAG